MEKLMDAVRHVKAEVVIVNDGDDEIAYRFAQPGVRVVKNVGSGVAAARNTGVKHATSDILLFMDDDMWLTSEAINRMLQVHRDQESIALNVNWVYPEVLSSRLVGTAFGRYLIHHGFTSLKGWFGKSEEWRDKEPFVTMGITSQNLSMRRSTFQKSGGYNEAFPMAGFEDHDYSRRLNKSGIRIVVDPTVMMFHNEADRSVIKDWLNRKIRGGVTRRVAVNQGYRELQLTYSWPKRNVLLVAGYLKPAIVKVIESGWSNRSKQLDRISFPLINLLLTEAIFRGYELGGLNTNDKSRHGQS